MRDDGETYRATELDSCVQELGLRADYGLVHLPLLTIASDLQIGVVTAVKQPALVLAKIHRASVCEV
jgi:hypothetical protein